MTTLKLCMGRHALSMRGPTRATRVLAESERGGLMPQCSDGHLEPRSSSAEVCRSETWPNAIVDDFFPAAQPRQGGDGPGAHARSPSEGGDADAHARSPGRAAMVGALRFGRAFASAERGACSVREPGDGRRRLCLEVWVSHEHWERASRRAVRDVKGEASIEAILSVLHSCLGLRSRRIVHVRESRSLGAVGYDDAGELKRKPHGDRCTPAAGTGAEANRAPPRVTVGAGE